MRVFSDRMINNDDILVFEKLMARVVEEEFDARWENIFKIKNKNQNIIWVCYHRENHIYLVFFRFIKRGRRKQKFE